MSKLDEAFVGLSRCVMAEHKAGTTTNAPTSREMVFTIGGDVEAIHTGAPVIKYPNPPRHHRDLIIAWANGADIAYESAGIMIATLYPAWNPTVKYSLIASQTPKELKIAKLEAKLAKLKGKL